MLAKIHQERWPYGVTRAGHLPKESLLEHTRRDESSYGALGV